MQRSIGNEGQRRCWNDADSRTLMWYAGVYPIPTMCRLLGRTERSVRCKLHRLGVSARIRDGWSPRQLQAIYGMSLQDVRRELASGRLRIQTALLSVSGTVVSSTPWSTAVLKATDGMQQLPLEWVAHILHRSRRDIFKAVSEGPWRLHHLRVTDDSVARSQVAIQVPGDRPKLRGAAGDRRSIPASVPKNYANGRSTAKRHHAV